MRTVIVGPAKSKNHNTQNDVGLPNYLQSSIELLVRVPWLKDDPFWEPFKTDYDCSDAQAKREKVYSASAQTPNKALKLLKDLAERAKEDFHLATILGDGPSKDEAAKKLGEYFLEILDAPEKAQQLLQVIKKRNDIPRIQRPFRAMNVFLRSIGRHKRLPSKQDLKIEVWHDEIKKIEYVKELMSSLASMQHGDFYGEKRIISVRNLLREKNCYRVETVHENQWCDPKIGDSEWSKDSIKPLGFSGLPRANQVKNRTNLG